MSSFHEPPHGEEEKGDRHQEEGAAAQLAPLSLEPIASPEREVYHSETKAITKAMQPSPARGARYLRPWPKPPSELWYSSCFDLPSGHPMREQAERLSKVTPSSI